MSFVVAELLGRQVDGFHKEAISAVNQLNQFIFWVENKYLDPKDATSEIPITLNKLADPAWDLQERLSEIGIYNEEAFRIAKSLEDEIENCISRFWKWSHREFTTAKEAAEKYGKHRSTIYRWIKSGKLNAEKEKGRWKILDD